MVVEGTLIAGVDYDRLSVVALQEGTSTPLALATLEGADASLPATVNFESGPATPAGTRLWVRATAERAGVVRSAVMAEATLTEKTGVRLTLTLPPIPPPPDAGMQVEVCDNGVDDDGDGLRDCADGECDNRGCQPGGLFCGGGVCGCGGRAAGAPVSRPGFARRSQPVALMPRSGPLANALVVAGGRDALGRPSAALDVFFVETSRFSLRTLAVERAEPSLVALNDGGVVVLGGVRTGEVPEQSLEWLEADGGTTRVTFNPGLGAQGATAGRLGPDVLLAGGLLTPMQQTDAGQTDAGQTDAGRTDAGRSNLAVRVSPSTGAQQVLGQLSLACPAGGAPLGTSFLLAGGCPGTGPTSRTDLIGPTGTVGPGPLLPVALEGPAVVGLTPNQVLVLGGQEQAGAGLMPSSRVFLVELVGSVARVRELQRMDGPRAAPRAVRAGNGWLYVEDTAGAPPLWFDPAAERFTPATALPTRRNHALAGGSGPQVYAAGGTGADGGLEDTASVLELRCF
ncbi:MAG TPA: hypothetical protein VK539_03405 [Myxococcaceae bacterium]|nr:hypothetical protein [Myxococcaceae bacterium]